MPTEVSATGAVPFPYDPVRTAIVQMHLEPGMIADRVLPQTPPMGKSAFKYFKYDIDDAFVLPDTRLGRKGMPTEVEFSGTEIVDATEHYGLLDSVPVEDQDAAGDAAGSSGEWADPVDTAGIYLTHLLKLDREVRVASQVFNTNSYDASYRMALGANDKFSNDDSDPWKTLETALTTPIFRPNVVVFGQEVWSKFRAHPKVLKAAHGSHAGDAGLATRQRVAEILEVDEVLVGRSRVASSKQGQELALRRTWGKFVACIYRGAFAGNTRPSGKPGSEMQENIRSDLKLPTFGFTAVYQPLQVLSRFHEGKGIKGVTDLIVRESCKEVVAGKEFGYLISAAVA